MTAPLSSISGLISGVDTSSLIDAIITQAREPAAAMETQETNIKNQQTAITSYSTILSALDTAATALQNGTAFGNAAVSTTVLAGTQALATASATSAAVPGTYQLQVSSLAAAEKLGSIGQASATAALSLTGTFTVSGQSVNVLSTDSLTAVRDKINALDTGATPSGVTASILAVSPTDNRLILTSDATGATGAALADTSGTVLQSLGFLNSSEAKLTSAVLVAGSNANFTLDTIPISRSSNTVTDAIAGVTLNLTAAQSGATTQLTVSHDESSAANAMQNFVTSYNAVINFLSQQGTIDPTNTTTDPVTGATIAVTPALYGNSLITSLRSALPSAMLQTVQGAVSGLSTAASAGLSLQSDGTLSFDASTFASAFQTQFSGLQSLFGETRTADSANVSFVSSGTAGASGSWDVNITAPATAATLSTSGFSGTYDAGATPDTLTLTDKQSGKNVQVNLTTGMTTSDIVSALQTAINGANLGISVSTSGSDIVMTDQTASSYAGFTVAVSGVGDGASEAWGATSTATGTDIQGTIGGFAATGSGSTLVGNSSTPVAGLAVSYSGTTAGDMGNITLDVGLGTGVKRLIDTYTDPSSGLIALHSTTLTNQNANLVQRVADIDARLALRRAALVQQYAAMEATIGALNGQAQSLLGLNSATTGTNTTSSSSSSSSPSSSLG